MSVATEKPIVPKVYSYVSNIEATSNPKASLIVKSMLQTMIACPFCKRKFGLKAADRHIEFCKK